jgi:hypothetical protein
VSAAVFILARPAALIAFFAAGGVVAAIFALPWYEYVPDGFDRNGWAALPEVGAELALAGIAGAVALAGAVFGVRVPRWLAWIGVLASAALAALVGFRLADTPNLPLPAADYATQEGPAVALAAAILALLSLLPLLATTGQKKCPDCAESVAHDADACPHCGHKFPLARGWRRCPECSGKVRAEARLCKHCHHEIGGAEAA